MLFARQFEREEWDTLWMHLSPFCLSKGQALLHKVPVPSDHCGGKSVPVVILSGLLFCLRITACSLTGDCDLVSDTFAPAHWGLPHVKNWMTAGCPDLSVSLIQVTFLIYQPFTTHKGLGDREDGKTLGVRYLPSCNPVQTAQGVSLRKDGSALKDSEVVFFTLLCILRNFFGIQISGPISTLKSKPGPGYRDGPRRYSSAIQVSRKMDQKTPLRHGKNKINFALS